MTAPPAALIVCLVGTYPPTACGIATFTSNLRAAIAGGRCGWEADVVRVLDAPEPVPASHVVAQWVTSDPTSLSDAHAHLDRYEAVLLQHEFGIYPGDEGEQVLDLVAGLQAPLVSVLHTALAEPNATQRRVIDELVGRSSAVVVQSRAARDRLVATHGLAADSLVVIPHGAADNLSGPPTVSLARPAILTWGLLGPGKGIEHGIAALAQLPTDGDGPCYVIAGGTHPKVRAREGERYRESLESLATELGVADRVRFDDGYRDWDSLRALVRAADVVLLPYDSRDQISSGVLVEALASGKPVVATRFPHAVELLSDGAGLLVNHGDVDAMAAALASVLFEPGVGPAMAAAAERAARPLLWPAVGDAYRQVLAGVTRARGAA